MAARSRMGRSEPSDFQVEADVEVRSRIRKRAYGDQVGPGVGVGAHAVEGYSARHLDGDTTPDDGHRFGDPVRAHVVEQDEAGAGRHRLVDLLQVLALDLRSEERRVGKDGRSRWWP